MSHISRMMLAGVQSVYSDENSVSVVQVSQNQDAQNQILIDIIVRYRLKSQYKKS